MKRNAHNKDPVIIPHPITIRSSQEENNNNISSSSCIVKMENASQPSDVTGHVLDLSNERIEIQHIHFFTNFLPTDTVIEELQLSNNHATKCLGAEVIATSLEQNTCVKVVNLMNNRIGGKGVGALANTLRYQNSTIEVLHLSGNPCGSVGAIALATALDENTTLQGLSLDGCGIRTDGISALADILLDNHPSLRELRIRGNPGGTISAAKSLGAALKKNTVLTALLVGFRSEHLNESMNILRHTMQYNISLRYLFIMNNQSREYVRPPDLTQILNENRYAKYATQHEVPHALIPCILAKSKRPSFLFALLQSQINAVAEGLQSRQQQHKHASFLSSRKRRKLSVGLN